LLGVGNKSYFLVASEIIPFEPDLDNTSVGILLVTSSFISGAFFALL